MAASALILFSLVNNNTNPMSNLFNLNYLKAQEKKKLKEIKKQYSLHKCNQIPEYKPLRFNNKSNKSNYYNHSNFNITKENKR